MYLRPQPRVLADMTFAILLSLIRRVSEAEEYVKKGLWRAWEPNLFLGEELQGKYFGIIGFGKIGKAVAERALGFGLKVLGYARSKFEMGRVKQVPLEELYEKSHFISLHVPLTPGDKRPNQQGNDQENETKARHRQYGKRPCHRHR